MTGACVVACSGPPHCRGGAKRRLAELGRVLKLSKERYVAAYDISLIYAALGETDDTFLWLDRAVADRSTLMVFLAQDPMLECVPRRSAVRSAGRAHRGLSSEVSTSWNCRSTNGLYSAKVRRERSVNL